MSKFIIIYYPGKQHANTSPEEGAEGRAKFGAWLAGLGDAVVDPGTPLGKRKTVTSDGVSDGGGANSFMGFSVVQADSLDAAVGMAKDCPLLEMGKVEVAEMMEM